MSLRHRKAPGLPLGVQAARFKLTENACEFGHLPEAPVVRPHATNERLNA
jgi:hypothetical protein